MSVIYLFFTGTDLQSTGRTSVNVLRLTLRRLLEFAQSSN